MESFGWHTQFLLKQGGGRGEKMAQWLRVLAAKQMIRFVGSAPTLGGLQLPATPLGSNTLWSPQVPACGLPHRNSQRYINIYIKKKSIKGKILFVFLLFCFRPLYPILFCMSPASWGTKVHHVHTIHLRSSRTNCFLYWQSTHQLNFWTRTEIHKILWDFRVLDLAEKDLEKR